MNHDFSELLSKWRSRADELAPYAASAALAWRNAADELETFVRGWALAELTIEEAAGESGYSYSAIQKKLANGELENVGGKGAPRVRRNDLPRKGGTAKDGLANLILHNRSCLQ
jgi:hypothetical protein